MPFEQAFWLVGIQKNGQRGGYQVLPEDSFLNFSIWDIYFKMFRNTAFSLKQ